METFKYLWENHSHLWTAEAFFQAIMMAQRYLDGHTGEEGAVDAVEDLMLFLMRSKTSHGLFLVLPQA